MMSLTTRRHWSHQMACFGRLHLPRDHRIVDEALYTKPSDRGRICGLHKVITANRPVTRLYIGPG
jgi:hypothetical protein